MNKDVGSNSALNLKSSVPPECHARYLRKEEEKERERMEILIILQDYFYQYLR